MSVTHIAGQDVHLNTDDGSYLRQRCAWCGDVLLEHNLARVAVPTNQPGPPATWPVGALVRIDGSYSTIRAATADGKLPFDSCTRNPLTLPGL